MADQSRRSLDRRAFLKILAGAAGATAAGSLLAACGAQAPATGGAAATSAPAAGGGAAAAPTAASSGAAASGAGKLEMFSWWTTGGEEAGLKAMYAIYEKRRPGVEIINQAVAGGSGA
ncbi:MAG TPA: hypothetical protein VFX76_15115, partial [Roseiflexaceae bacterium]|nr:hypothetical protein [Roseiflexaceae bacterium]